MNIPSFLRLKLPVRAVPYCIGLCIALSVAAVFWICTFKIMDRDFWWHVSAGNLMMQTWEIIKMDPFAYTRAGLPYLATHEWLAQIILAFIYNTFGSTGIILFRAVVACITAGLILLLDPKRIFPNILLALWAVVITKGSYLERPQLFTFIFFAAFLLLAFRFLDTQSIRVKIGYCVTFILLELLWVNMHGGAALMGGAIVFFLFVHSLVRTVMRSNRTENGQSTALLLGTGIAMAITIILPPNGFGTIQYLSDLLNDQTILFIAEWQPRTWSLYIRELWLFWILAIASLGIGRRHVLFNGLLLLMTAYLSRQAFRHEILFILSAIATVFYQANHSAVIARWRLKSQSYTAAIAVGTVLLALLLGRIAYVRSINFERPENLYGFGQFDLARGAADYLEMENVQGNMFNTYGIGGYLIYRGRPVFIDGRNVDYGLDFMAKTYAAGIDEERWDDLVDEHDVSYAVVDYDAIRQKDSLPYSSILDEKDGWLLTYLDDWTAVYLKDTPANRLIADRWQYQLLTATNIQFHDGFDSVPDEELPALIAELEHMRAGNPQGTKATIALAKIALRQQRFADAESLAHEAMNIRRYAPEPLGILGASYVAQEKWTEAADAYDKLLELAGDQYPDIDYGFIASVYERAGLSRKADRYAKKAGRDLPTASGSTQEMGVNPVADAVEFNDIGIEQAQNGALDSAEESFMSALKINPSYAEAWNNLCALLLQKNLPGEAIAHCKKAVEFNPSYADAHFNLALAYYQSGSFADAEKYALLAEKLGRKEEAATLLKMIRQSTSDPVQKVR